MTMRSLSISETFRWHISARRRPVAYSVISMVRCIRFSAESISRATSCWTEYGRQLPGTLGKWNVHREDTAGAAS